MADMAGLLVIFLPWLFLVVSGGTALWASRQDGGGVRIRVGVLGTSAAVEAAGVAAVLINRHERQWSEGLARLWPFRIYVATGLLLAIALIACVWQLRRLWRGERSLAAPIFGICSALLPFWLVLSGLVYSA